jgi:hypothetical protein
MNGYERIRWKVGGFNVGSTGRCQQAASTQLPRLSTLVGMLFWYVTSCYVMVWYVVLLCQSLHGGMTDCGSGSFTSMAGWGTGVQGNVLLSNGIQNAARSVLRLAVMLYWAHVQYVV